LIHTRLDRRSLADSQAFCKEDLVPAFDAKEFDEEGVVTGRKFYAPEKLPEKK
jgi:hypothetical protein